MSHFSVAVFTKELGQSIGDLLAPYDENLKVAPYVSRTKAQLIQDERDFLQGAYERSKDHPDGPAEDILERMKETDEEIYQRATKNMTENLNENGDYISTRNPNSKWDWWTIGGRWGGLLITKVSVRKAKLTKSKTYEQCNAAFAADIDFETMRRREAEELRPYEVAMKSSLYKESYMRERFPTEDEYVKRLTNFSTYAVVTPDGNWHEPGEMGWFGISGASPEAEREWELSYYDRFTKPAIENNWFITIVDCHI